MTTHEVEEMLSITKKTLIYYENEGLEKPARDSNNYRNYNQQQNYLTNPKNNNPNYIKHQQNQLIKPKMNNSN